jgi:vacuolar-type H+-ATPase subunit F/Vma7
MNYYAMYVTIKGEERLLGISEAFYLGEVFLKNELYQINADGIRIIVISEKEFMRLRSNIKELNMDYKNK